MTTQIQPWLRAELIAAPETTPGAQLMIPADGIEFHDDHLVFHHQGDVVYVAPQGQLRSITWLARQPNPATARRKAQWPNHGTRWTDEEREDLLHRLQAGQSWKAVSTAHGRSRSGCQQEAVKQGWLDPDTLRLKPELLADPGTADPAAAADPEAPRPAPASTPADESSESQAAPSPAPVPDLTAGDPAGPSAAAHDTVAPVAGHAARITVPMASPHSDSTEHGPPRPGGHGTAESASPTPDRPQFPPRVPRQRTNSDTLPDSFPDDFPDIFHGPEPDADPESEPGPESGPRSGSRFLSRAQSSLARATLGAYLSPPRGESSAAAPGAP